MNMGWPMIVWVDNNLIPILAVLACFISQIVTILLVNDCSHDKKSLITKLSH